MHFRVMITGLHHVAKVDWNESFRNFVPKHALAR
jgi:hypothetical protein